MDLDRWVGKRVRSLNGKYEGTVVGYENEKNNVSLVLVAITKGYLADFSNIRRERNMTLAEFSFDLSNAGFFSTKELQIIEVEIKTKSVISPGEVLKDYLKRNNMTQRQLALIIDVSERYLSTIASDKHKMTENIALKLEKAFEGVKAEFWMKIEVAYRLHLLRQR